MNATSNIKAKPIIFTGESPCLILDGTKTQTRRVVRNPERLDGLMLEGEAAAWCPYGGPGDLLWVRETWKAVHDISEASKGGCHHWRYVRYSDGVMRNWGRDRDNYDRCCNPRLVAECPDDTSHYEVGRSSRFMPRWASRIMLEITKVRVERVQDINERDAELEGCRGHNAYTFEHEPMGHVATAVERFHDLWDCLHAKRGFGWDANPWVWVLDFKVVA